MNGIVEIRVRSKKLVYDLVLRRNITIICGDSATGKTNLIGLLNLYLNDKMDGLISVECKYPCYVLTPGDTEWKTKLARIHNTVVFADADVEYVSSKEFAEAMQGSSNYFVFITRESLFELSYNTEEIYGFRVSNKYNSLSRTYNELYPILGNINEKEKVNKMNLISEVQHD